MSSALRAMSPSGAERAQPLPHPLANRYTYFLRRERNLEHWVLTGPVCRLDHAVDVEQLAEAVRVLLVRHPGLRLRGSAQGGSWAEWIADPDDHTPVVELTQTRRACSEAELLEHLTAAVADPRQSFTFGSSLLRIVCVSAAAARVSLLTLVAHHLLVDDHSFRLVIDDFLRCYHSIRLALDPPPLRPAAELHEFIVRSTEHWLSRGAEELAYWQRLPWPRGHSLRGPVAHWKADNIEQHTRCSQAWITVPDERGLLARFYRAGRVTMMEVLLCAIGDAYRDWTGEALNLATVLHGRGGTEGVNLADTVGWISETVPLVLGARCGDDPDLLNVRAQLTRAQTHGRSYGVLRHLCENEGWRSAMQDLPLPEVSLNVKLRGQGGRAPNGVQTIMPWTPPARPGPDTTQRVFLLSGGVFFANGHLCFSWDYSERVFSSASVEEFTRLCMARFLTYSERTAGLVLRLASRPGG